MSNATEPYFPKDPGLLSIMAAIDIDNNILKRDNGWSRLNNVRAFEKIFSNTSKSLIENQREDFNQIYDDWGFITWFEFYDTLNKPVGDYLGKEIKGEKVALVHDELAKSIEQIANDLGKFVNMPDKVPIKQKEKLREFCTELSKSFRAYKSQQNSPYCLVG